MHLSLLPIQGELEVENLIVLLDEVIIIVIEIQEKDWKTFIVERRHFVPIVSVTACSAP